VMPCPGSGGFVACLSDDERVIQPSPNPFPSPIVTPSPVERSTSPLPVIVIDTVRDGFDKWGFVITIGSAVFGLALSVIAVWLALQAKRDTAAAEIRGMGRATRERRVLFELEMLRDLVEAMGNGNLLSVVNHGYNFRTAFGGALRFFPSDLPTWHAMAAREQYRDSYKIFPVPQENVDEYESNLKLGSYATMSLPTGISLERVRDALLVEVETAIDARMLPVDVLPPNPRLPIRFG